MVTIFALDCSLSMSRSIDNSRVGKSKLDCAKECTESIIKYLLSEVKQSFIQTAIISYSSEAELVYPFNQIANIQEIRLRLKKIQYGDKSKLIQLMKFIKDLMQREWGSLQMVDVIILTDAKMSSLKALETDLKTTDMSPSPCRLHFLCFETAEKLQAAGFQQTVEKLIKKSTCDLVIHPLLSISITKSAFDSVVLLLNNYIITYFKSIPTQLNLGSITSEVTIFPPARLSSSSQTGRKITEKINIAGFISIHDVGTPPVVSRHMILPIKSDSSDAHAANLNLLLLLHAAMLQENKIALAFINQGIDERPHFGFLHTSNHSTDKEKQSLMLSLLSDESDTVSWLGSFEKLGFLSQWKPVNPRITNPPSFPVNPLKSSKRSYSSPMVSWTRITGLQTDIQKLVRIAKKLPEKSQIFYKDLNRLLRASLSFGCFKQIKQSLVFLLDCERLNSAPSLANHLSVAINQLRVASNYNYDSYLEPATKHSKRA